MRASRFLAVVLLGWILGVPARAGALAWEVKAIQVDAQAGQEVVTVVFPFRNIGAIPVGIVSVETSCRCTAASSDRTTYKPGEKGRISVAFTIRGQEGPQEKEITVSTDEPGARPVNLELRVRIPGPK